MSFSSGYSNQFPPIVAFSSFHTLIYCHAKIATRIILQKQARQTKHLWKRRWREWRYERGRLVPTDCVEAYEEADKHPALVLWGEPGLGKTHELLRAYDALIEHGALALFISLGPRRRAEELT